MQAPEKEQKIQNLKVKTKNVRAKTQLLKGTGCSILATLREIYAEVNKQGSVSGLTSAAVDVTQCVHGVK